MKSKTQFIFIFIFLAKWVVENFPYFFFFFLDGTPLSEVKLDRFEDAS